MDSETTWSMDQFPVFKRVRRYLGVDHPFFIEGELHREIHANRISSRDADDLIKEVVGELDIPVHFSLRPFCSICKLVLPTEHLLNLHLAESHDSFFAAQAARKMPVFECLVESCMEKFTSRACRESHLFHHHQFPQGYNYENLHRPSKRSLKQFDDEARKPRREERKRNKKKNSKKKAKKDEMHAESVSSTSNQKGEIDMDLESMEEAADSGEVNRVRTVGGSSEMDVDKVAAAFSRMRTTEGRMPTAPRFGHRRGGSMMMLKTPVVLRDGQFQRQHLPPAKGSKNEVTSNNETATPMDCDSNEQ